MGWCGFCAAGYTPKQSRKGRAAIPAAVFELMTREELLAYESLGKKLLKDKRKLECCVVGFIYSKMALGRDDGVKAARLLGEHCRVTKTDRRSAFAKPAIAHCGSRLGVTTSTVRGFRTISDL